MSKESALRAMREARYSRRAAAPAARLAPRMPEKAEETVVAAPAVSADGLCGHRSMNGRTCTREHGHEAKSHRYS
ncbi:hypothetical protein [Nocardioides panacisoli]|uniref:DUF3761 domain-containing protein n=1 Tax=Nocardioides panacisoli TaxID=627624 RepID=A0ABP7J911_9ACTN